MTKRMMVLTGAGVSAESGIPTFRGSDGLWEGYRPEEVATPEAFARNPELVHRFYNLRRRQLQQPEIQPNAAHRALAELERSFDGEVLLVTQNVDDLHARAGSRNLLAMHGQLMEARCVATGDVFRWTDDLSMQTRHPERPDLVGTLRPHIVWFGETPFGLEKISDFAADCDWFLAIGTSAVVYPAAGIVDLTPAHCRRIEINLEATPQSPRFETSIRGRASEEVPKCVARFLSD